MALVFIEFAFNAFLQNVYTKLLFGAIIILAFKTWLSTVRQIVIQTFVRMQCSKNKMLNFVIEFESDYIPIWDWDYEANSYSCEITSWMERHNELSLLNAVSLWQIKCTMRCNKFVAYHSQFFCFDSWAYLTFYAAFDILSILIVNYQKHLHFYLCKLKCTQWKRLKKHKIFKSL